MGALLLAALGAPAVAQQTPGNAIEDRSREQLRPPSETERAESILTGDTDIVLTRRTRLFTLSGSAQVSYTSNAFLAPGGETDDGYGQLQAAIGAGTRIGGKVDVFASAGVVTIRYFENGALDYSAVSGAVGARTSLGRLAVTAIYQPSVVLTRDFGRHQLTTHRLRLTATLPVRAGPFLVEPGIGAERTIADPSDYDAWSFGASLTASAPLSRRVPLLAYAGLDYERRVFDGYFPSLVGVDRRDDALAASAGLIWRPRRWGEMRLSYMFQRNWSTSDVNRYKAHTGRLGLSAVLRF